MLLLSGHEKSRKKSKEIKQKITKPFYLCVYKYIYRILWCNGHIIAFKNHIRITFTE